jgi:hypothetical protein
MPDGEPDPTFSGDGVASIGPVHPTAVVARPDDDAVVVGVTEQYFGGTALVAVRVGAGAAEPDLAPYAYYEYRHPLTGAMAQAEPDGSILFVGNSAVRSRLNYMAVARFDRDLWRTERAKVRMLGVQAATVDRRGSILTAGPWLTGRDSPVFFIERYLHRRRLDRSFGDPDGQSVIRIRNPAELIGMIMTGDKLVVGGFTRAPDFASDETATIYRLHARQDDARPRITVRGLGRPGCADGTRTLRVRIRDESRTRTRVRLDGRRLTTTARKRFRLPLDTTALKPGPHNLTVRALDAAGNRGAVARTIHACG